MTKTWNRFRRGIAVTSLAAMLAAPGTLLADPQPAPPFPPPPPPPMSRPMPPPPPRYYPPPVVAPPPPLSPLMRVVYAPFYAAGLVVRYGFYYLIVAPFEVFGRTVTYGANGGVEPPPPPPRPRDDEEQ
jgi:hypothetical protein